MQLKLDPNKKYAIALSGGGAKGGYEVGAWKALNELGIRYNAVSGASVGALNGALMVMHEYEKAVEVWSSVQMTNIVAAEDGEAEKLKRLFSKTPLGIGELREYLPKIVELFKGGGLDIGPLRNWMREVIVPEKIRNSDVELFITTLSLTERKGLEIKVNDLDTDEKIFDMLLASAYHPAFKNEPLSDGKQYADGGMFDPLPLHVLIENGYKDIIAVKPGGGLGIDRIFKIPDNVKITMVKPNAALGGSLAFDAERAQYHMEIGYFDTMKALYGLYGRKYYIDRTLSERNALDWILDRFERNGKRGQLRKLVEQDLPGEAKRLGVKDGDYYELMIAILEEEAEKRGVKPLMIRSDISFMREVSDAELEKRKAEKKA